MGLAGPIERTGLGHDTGDTIVRKVIVVSVAALGWALGAAPALATPAVPAFAACSAAPVEPGAPYYAIELVPTGRVPGTRQAKGEARVAFARSAFGLAVTSDGRYVYDLRVEFRDLASFEGDFVVWLAKADLSEVRAIGALDDSRTVASSVDWNKFLVVVTLETDAAQLGAIWQGPIVFRGMSRSGRMHTMAGHGPFQAEPCSKYGY